jgi:hypothetical protein
MNTVKKCRFMRLIKTAMGEVLSERKDLLCEALRENLEGVAMLRAIQSGEKSSLVSRKKIFRRFARRSQRD